MNVEVSKLIDQLLVVLVLYETKLDQSPSFVSLSGSLSGSNASLFVYDNSRAPQICASTHWGIIYQHDSSNPGVSKAYNVGFRKAMELNKKWMLLVDQDTTFPEDFFEKLSEAIVENPAFEIFVPKVKSNSDFISPFQFKWGRGFRSQAMSSGLFSLNNFKFINSGLLISTSLFEKSNGYDERFPLDYSDLAFLERIKKYQHKFVVTDTTCIQQLSSDGVDKSKALNRFGVYLKASRLFGKVYGYRIYGYFIRTARTIKLSYQFRSISFLKLLLKLK